MAKAMLEEAAREMPALNAVFLTVMPDCLLFDSWTRDNSELGSEEAATYFGDLVRANREGLKTLGSWSSEMQVTIESEDKLIVLREISGDFVCSCVFERGVPLGMVRLHMKRLLGRISSVLPTFQVEERPRGVRVVEFLNRYAPDPHAVLMRVALRTGIPRERLDAPESLAEEEVTSLEGAARKILNLKTLNV